MVRCGALGCSNTDLHNCSSKIVARHFLRFYKVPNNPTMRPLWISRTRRGTTSDIDPETMVVCSDHFCDGDFEKGPFQSSKTTGFLDLMVIPLKEDAIPNTNRFNGNMVIRGPAMDLPESSSEREERKLKRERRKNMPNIELRISSLIEENDALVERSASVLLRDSDPTFGVLEVEGSIALPSRPKKQHMKPKNPRKPKRIVKPISFMSDSGLKERGFLQTEVTKLEKQEASEFYNGTSTAFGTFSLVSDSTSSVIEYVGTEEKPVQLKLYEGINATNSTKTDSIETNINLMFMCKICECYYPTKNGLDQHTKFDHSAAPERCSRRFRKQPPEIVVKLCDECGVRTSTEHVCLKREPNCDENKAPAEVLCEICTCSFSSKIKLYHHNQSVHPKPEPPDPFPCKVCDKGYKSRLSLSRHIKKRHKRCTSFVCKVCEKVFTKHHKLKRHLMLHEGSQPFPCKSCDKKFVTQGHLNRHAISHSGEKPFTCGICKRCFNQQCNLNTHMRLHVTEKRFQCRLCDSDFNHKCSLAAHMKRKHPGEELTPVGENAENEDPTKGDEKDTGSDTESEKDGGSDKGSESDREYISAESGAESENEKIYAALLDKEEVIQDKQYNMRRRVREITPLWTLQDFIFDDLLSSEEEEEEDSLKKLKR